MRSLTFEPIQQQQLVRTGTLLLDALDNQKLHVLKSCGGHGLCATCHVHVRGGMESLSPRNDREKRTLSFVSGTDASSRLACQTRIHGNGVIVEVPRGMYIEKAEDLLALLGTRAPEDILHPIKGVVLIARGKIITRTQIEALEHLKREVSTARQGHVAACPPAPPAAPPLPASTRSTTHFPVNTLTHSTSTATNGKRPSPEAAAAHNPEIGSQLGKCQLLSKLGSGSTGTVYRAHHRSLNIAVAVKVLSLSVDGQVISDPDAVRAKLRDEARLMAQLNHPHIVRVWDFDEEHEFPYVVLELVEGASMAELIQQSGRLAPERAVALARQVAEALQAAWELGVVHRDVKPGNILVTRDGKAKLADLGLACSFHEQQRSRSGTVAYMAPEQAVGNKIDHRSDIYALGATLYHAVTGQLPFTGKTWQEVFYKHANAPLVPPEEYAAGLPPALTALIGEMMAKVPEDRPQSYGELIADLTHCVPAPSAAPGSRVLAVRGR